MLRKATPHAASQRDAGGVCRIQLWDNRHVKSLCRNLGLVLLGILCFAAFAAAEETDVNVDALTAETQKTINDNRNIVFAWWIPVEYWQAEARKNLVVDREGFEELLRALEGYIVVALAKGNIRTPTDIEFLSESQVRDVTSVLDINGSAYRAIAATDLDPVAVHLFRAMKPVFANNFGRMGQGLHLLAFPAKDAAGNAIVDTRAPGKLALKVDREELVWRLPLSSLVPPKVCPIDGEVLSGAWSFCPWHGEKLLPRRAN